MTPFIKAGSASAIVGGQFGSEAKGLVAAWLSSRLGDYRGSQLICTTNAGAQAGHTTVLADGTKFVCYHLPTIGVMRPDSIIYLNAGSIIDIALLLKEVKEVSHLVGEDWGHMSNRIWIHPNAAIITDDAKSSEALGLTTHTGSTQKGVGAALAAKVTRQPYSTASYWRGPLDQFRVDALDLPQILDGGGSVTMEIPQGTGLSLNNSGFFPHCTSRDCWVGQGLTDAGLHPYYLWRTAMVVRTCPIRVGHIYEEGTWKVIGDSGPFYSDSRELDWAKDFPGVEPERTTVTKRVRRIASWSDRQYLDAIRLNRPTDVFLTFTNYMKDGGVDIVERMVRMHHAEKLDPNINVSHGPKVNQVQELIYSTRKGIG